MSVVADPAMLESAVEHLKREEMSNLEEESLVASEKKEDGALPPLESLTCQLCKAYFTEPVTLPCMHSFCKTCLEAHIGRQLAEEQEEEVEEENDAQEGEGKPEGSKKKEKEARPIKCPTCDEHLGLGEDASYFAEPFTNERLKRVVRLLHDSKILCENCQSTASEFRCNVCDSFVCDSCFKETHTAPIFKSHTPERLTHSEMTCPPKCESHRLNDIEYFCPEDEIGVCSLCLLKGEFKGKEYSLISDVRKQRQAEIEQGVSEALLQRAQLIEGRKEIEEVIGELAENLDAQKSAVKENFAMIRQALDARERETIDALEELHNTKKEVLDSQITAIDIQKGRIEDGVENINLVLNHSNDIEVVYLTYVLNNHIASLTNVPSTSPMGSSTGEPNHHPAVDADLPVVLSSKIPELVMAYASVPSAGLVEEIASGRMTASALQGSAGTKEQREILNQVAGTKVDGGEYGCLIQ